MRKLFAAGIAVAAFVACQEKTSGDAGPSASASASSAPVASAEAPPEKPWFAGEWAGSYDAKHFLIDMKPKEGAQPAWKKDDGTLGSGKGKIALTIDDKGEISGSAEGPLGPMRASGQADKDSVSLRFQATPAKEQKDVFNGFAVLKRAGDKLAGSFKASSGDSKLVRQAKVELEKSAN